MLNNQLYSFQSVPYTLLFFLAIHFQLGHNLIHQNHSGHTPESFRTRYEFKLLKYVKRKNYVTSHRTQKSKMKNTNIPKLELKKHMQVGINKKV